MISPTFLKVGRLSKEPERKVTFKEIEELFFPVPSIEGSIILI